MDDMEKQVKLWGSVPRIVLGKPEDFTSSALKNLVKVSNPEVLIANASVITETGENESNHRLIHIIPDANFEPFIKELCFDPRQRLNILAFQANQ